jgi:methylmalonyl-CoA mutase N-terminal domain/subunit
VESGEQIIVGVNRFQQSDEPPLEILQIGGEAGEWQRNKLASLRRRRNSHQTTTALAALREAAATNRNTMPYLLEAVKAYATVGEICDTLREVLGTWQEVSVL